ncbi:hypothetical protein ACS8FD_16460, partial [Psychrobacter sp. 1U2]
MASYRYPLPAIAISVTTLLVLNACQPITENSESTVLQNDETTTIEEVIAPSTQATEQETEQATKVDETIDG